MSNFTTIAVLHCRVVRRLANGGRMLSHLSEHSPMIVAFNLWVAQLMPTSMEDRCFVTNDELASCFFHHNSKWDTDGSRSELNEVLLAWRPGGVHPICTKTWKKVNCAVLAFTNGRGH